MMKDFTPRQDYSTTLTMMAVTMAAIAAMQALRLFLDLFRPGWSDLGARMFGAL